MIELELKNKILISRTAVDEYRSAHRLLYSKGWHKDIPKEHTPLLDILVGKLKKEGFNSLNEFSKASDRLNIEEFGFTSYTAPTLELANEVWG